MIIKEIQNLKHLKWSKIRNSSGTAGSFLKAYDIKEYKLYYKLSNYDFINGVIGHECVNELIVSRLLSLLGINHLPYKLINAEIIIDGKIINTYLCESVDFKKKEERKIPLDIFYELNKKNNESPLEFCIRMNWEDYIYEMLLVDFLILNRDRHGANIEILKDKSGKLRLAPLFDHGISLLSFCNTLNDINNYDVMEDKRVQSFVGGFSSFSNLKMIPKNKKPKIKSLKVEDKQYLLNGLTGIIPDELLEKIWDMIWKRWCYYENLFN